MTAPSVAVVILNWNGLEDTVECLESLQRIQYCNHHVLVLDNGSEGEDVAILKERFGGFAHIISESKNHGFAEGSNIAMRFALETYSPDYVLLLNNDTVVDPGLVAAMVEAAESDPEIGIAGAKSYYYDDPNRIHTAGGRIGWWRGRTYILGCNEIDRGQFESVADVDWVAGCALLVRSSVVEDIGWLFAGYFAYFEETEWCVRARRKGYRVVSAFGARLWHKRRVPRGERTELELYYVTRNRFLFMRRNARRLHLATFLVWFFLVDFGLSARPLVLPRRDPKRLRSLFRGTRDGVVQLCRTEEPQKSGEL